MKTLTEIFDEFRDQITLNNLTCEDKCLELVTKYMDSGLFLSVEFEDDSLDKIKVYGTDLENILTVKLTNYLDDEDLCRAIPVDLFISEMNHVAFTSYGFDDL